MGQRSGPGFILIELVTTLILIGVIGAFAGLFLYSGVNGYVASRRNSEAALKAQVALDRIGAELRALKPNPAPSFAARRITYQNDLGAGNRTLEIENGPQGPGIYLTVGGVKYLLLDNVPVETAEIAFTANRDLDNENNDNEIESIRVSFRMAGLETPFAVEIYPRALINAP
ncbi:MAG: hypothetical protein WHT06_05500 [Desulfobacterales bacterium]